METIPEDIHSQTGIPKLEEARALFDKLIEKKVSAEEASTAEVLDNIEECVVRKQYLLADRSRTASLWIQYLEIVDILRSVTDLRTDHPDVYRDFLSGLHVARRSDPFWAGLSIDLVIEQVIMRRLKSSGGLTRGRGLTEQQRLIWLLSMPACAETNHTMQKLTEVQFNSGEQNKDMSNARQTRDMKDTVTILSGLATHNPFSLDRDSNLRNIMNGVNADNNVNADTAKSVREKILSLMNGTLVTDY